MSLTILRRLYAWIPVFLVAVMFVGSYYIFVVELCFYTVTSIAERVTLLVIYNILFAMFLWSYIVAVSTCPATPPERFHFSQRMKELIAFGNTTGEFGELIRNAAKQHPIHTLTHEGNIRLCDKCLLIKPDRCHHCRDCNTCVLKFDHHCPLLNNCVGFSNYKTFLLVVLYGCLYFAFGAAASLCYMIMFWTGAIPDSPTKIPILVMFCIFTFILLLLFPFQVFHCHVAGRNRSTIEHCYSSFTRNGLSRDTFSLGFWQNLKQVLGDKKKWWLIPINTRLGDGYLFVLCLGLPPLLANKGGGGVVTSRAAWVKTG
uniref:Palmitoyltransferase n=1 Tax=Xenopus tropicalis TaxID=8364 RepID=A0A6I8SJY0_XENTR